MNAGRGVLSARGETAIRLIRAELDLAGRFVVIVGEGERSLDFAGALAGEWPTARLRLMLRELPPREARPPGLHLTPVARVRDVVDALAGAPLPDVIVELGSDRGYAGHGVFGSAFLALADGGSYVKADLASEIAAATEAGAEDSLWHWLQRSLPYQRQPSPVVASRNERQALEVAIGEALASVKLRDGGAVIRKRGNHLLKISEFLHRQNGEDRIEQTVLRRCGEGSVETIARHEPRVRSVDSPVWCNDSDAPRLRDTFTVRELVAREYRGAVCAPRGLITMDGLALPESSMQPLVRPWRSRGTLDTSGDYARFPHVHGTMTNLSGTYYHLDNEFPGHYGHVTTQDLSRLWAWNVALERAPDLRVLVSPPNGRQDLHEFHLRLLESFGIDRERVTVLRGPARVERLVSATLGFQNHYFASDVCVPIWDSIRDSLTREADQATPERVFIGRDDQRRRCLNGAEVERRFLDAGFVLVRPETLDIASQVRLFAQAKCVAGYAGSSMFTAAYASSGTRVIVIGSRSYTATNEHLLATLRRQPLHYFYCDPLIEQPEGGFSSDAYFSDYTFNLDRDGAALDALLGEI